MWSDLLMSSVSDSLKWKPKGLFSCEIFLKLVDESNWFLTSSFHISLSSIWSNWNKHDFKYKSTKIQLFHQVQAMNESKTSI